MTVPIKLHNTLKKVVKKFGKGVIVSLSLQPQSGTSVLYGWCRWDAGMVWYRVVTDCKSSFQRLTKKRVDKKFQKFSAENLENKIKSVNLHPLSMVRRWCWFVKQAWHNPQPVRNGSSWKKFEKRCQKIWKRGIKWFIFASAFVVKTGETNQTDEFFKILKRW